MGNQQESDLTKKSAEVFSSERREDYWALLIAMFTLILCCFFPDRIHDFFKTALFW